MKPNKFFILIAIITSIFCLAIAFDISPLLRGPAPYPPEWQWSYFFVNTLSKIYAPIIVISIILGLLWSIESKKILIHLLAPRSSKSEVGILLILLLLLSFSLQLSLLFFSRSGIPVLLHRIINPDLNSYFTASLTIHNPIDFLKNYDQEMKQFVYHARSHPPGAIFIFYLLKQIIAPFTYFINFANHITPSHDDVKQLWNTLLPLDKATAIFTAFFLPFLSTLTIIPLFLTGKILYNTKVATRATFLYTLIPSIIFFIPINDTFIPLFSISAFLFLLMGLQKNNLMFFFLSGFILLLGTSFNLALLPLLLFFFLFTIFYIYKNNKATKKYITGGIIFLIGFFILPVSAFIFLNFNSIQLIQTIFTEVPHVHSRSYTAWLFYNIYDFFVFAGIPLAIIFLTQLKELLTSLRGALATKQSLLRLPRFLWSLAMTEKADILFFSFLITLFLIDLTGSTRGETGRIWAVYLPFLILPATAFFTREIKFSAKFFIGLLLLQFIQILFMQEFWVMLW